MRWLALLLAAIPAVVCAAPSCPVPANLAPPETEGATADQPPRAVPIVGYTLAMIWEPQQCAAPVPGAAIFKCAGAPSNRFVLHGLWPDGEGQSWPQWCAAAPVLPRRLVQRHYCATPSAQLLQHEWAKHGTCMPGYDAARYLGRAETLFKAIRKPDLAAHGPGTAAEVIHAFAAVNPRLPGEAVKVDLDRDGWLRQVWVCLDTRFRPRRCEPDVSGATGAEPVRLRRASAAG